MKRTTVEEFDADGKVAKWTVTEEYEDDVVKYVPCRSWLPCVPSTPWWERWVPPAITYTTTGGSDTKP